MEVFSNKLCVEYFLKRGKCVVSLPYPSEVSDFRNVNNTVSYVYFITFSSSWLKLSFDSTNV